MLINGQCKHGIPIADRCSDCYPPLNWEYAKQDSEREFQKMLKLVTESNDLLRLKWREYIEDMRGQASNYGNLDGEIPDWFKRKYEKETKNGVPEIHVDQI